MSIYSTVLAVSYQLQVAELNKSLVLVSILAALRLASHLSRRGFLLSHPRIINYSGLQSIRSVRTLPALFARSLAVYNALHPLPQLPGPVCPHPTVLEHLDSPLCQYTTSEKDSLCRQQHRIQTSTEHCYCEIAADERQLEPSAPASQARVGRTVLQLWQDTPLQGQWPAASIPHTMLRSCMHVFGWSLHQRACKNNRRQ